MPSSSQKKPASSRSTASGGKRASGGSSARSSSSRSPSGTSRRSQPAPKPIRREIGAVVCLFLALFAALGYFGLDGIFINLLSDGLKGLIGYGYWLTPPLLLLCAYILAFHRGRPVRLRLTCALLFPVLLGAFLHLTLCKLDYPWAWAMVKTLWADGLALKCGGVLGGLLSLSFSAVFSGIGAGVVFVVLAALCVLGMFHLNLIELVEDLRSRPRREYDPEDFPPPSPKPVREKKPPVTRTAATTRPSDVDIPLDDVPRVHVNVEHTPKKTGFFDKDRRVPTPGEFISGAASRPPKKDKLPTEDVPVDLAEEEPPVWEEASDLPGDDTLDALEPPFTVPSPGVPLSADADPDVMTPAKPVADKPSEKVTAKEAKAAAEEVTQEISQSLEQAAPMAYQYPPVSLLKQESGVEGGQALGELKMNQDRLAEAIRSFGVDANIVNVVRGPSVTRYEMELDQGVKLSRVTNLADDIALALGAEAVRIAPIPDKISTVGIEVPNKLVSTVHIHDVIDSNAFTSSASKVSFAVGKDIGGNCIVGNIAKLPHLLIAGTTGSGKSVCTNSLIISLLYKATPEEVRLIMVDPKMVELGIYNGIPHLLIPVVTDPKKAAGALQWAVTEMMKRYRAFSEVGVRDLASYNAKAAKTEGMEKMPQVVVLIDELADLMLVAAKEVEESICRVAQMGRASGMHLVIATQRPSADVITGLMKANIPSRIAFAVSSSLESRIILDTTGAEKLVGKGDMLWFPLGAGKPHRVQGCFVSDEEVAAVVDFVKQSGSAEYDEAVMEEIDRNAQDKDKGAKGAGGAPGGDSSGEDFDELLPAAIEVVVEMGQASVSMLQRRLKLGYGRAARLVDQMEEKGVVGPFEGAKPRQVLVTKEQWQEMQYRQGLSPAPASAAPSSEPPSADTPQGFDDAPPFDPEDDLPDDN